MPSKYYKYKQYIRFLLVRKHGWSKLKSKEWTNRNNDYIRGMWERPISPRITADLINEIECSNVD